MTARRQTKAVPAIDRSHVVTELPGEFQELVGIRDEAGVYRVHARELNVETGTESVILFGGPNKQWRAVRPEKLRRVTKRQIASAGKAAS